MHQRKNILSIADYKEANYMGNGIWNRVTLITIISIVLMSTVFYEEPSCTTSNTIDLINFFVPIVIAILLSEFIMWLCDTLCKSKKKGTDGDSDNDTCF